MPAKTEANRYSRQEQSFLDSFRALENACGHEKNCSVLDFERSLEDRSRPQDMSRLRACRIIRNYLVHDGPGFLAVTSEMSKFLDGLVYEIQTENGTAKDVMISIARYGSATPDTKISDAAGILAAKKRDNLILINSDGSYAGIFDSGSMIACLADRKIMTVKQLIARDAMKKLTVPTVKHDDPVSTLPKGRAVVLKNNKPVGVINPQEAWEPC